MRWRPASIGEYLCRWTAETRAINQSLIVRQCSYALYSGELMPQHGVARTRSTVTPARRRRPTQIPRRSLSLSLYTYCASRVPNKLDPFKSALTTVRGAFFRPGPRAGAFIPLCCKPILCSLDRAGGGRLMSAPGRRGVIVIPGGGGNAPNLILA